MPNDITVTKNTTVGSERWDVEYTADQAATVTKTLETAGTMLDRDIKVSVTTPAGSIDALNATKGRVSNNSVTVTAALTKTAGYIDGGPLQGSSVTVSASELVSGTKTIDAAGTTDVTNYAEASVAAGSAVASATKGTVSNNSVTVTPSVTKTAGYITAGTASGTPVVVTASELVSGTKNITQNGSHDVTNYASAEVSVPTGTARSSADLTASGDTVTAPAGLYAEAASKAVAAGSIDLLVASRGRVANNSINITPAVRIVGGDLRSGSTNGNATTVTASELVSGTKTITGSGTTDVTNYAEASVAAGSASTPATTITANPTISVNSSTGVITATASASKSVTPSVSAGWVSSGTAGTVSVSGSNTQQLSTQAAQTITPGTTDQTIAAGKYLTGAQTIKGDANLVAANIAKDVSIFGVTGTHEGGGGGGGWTLLGDWDVTVNTTSTSTTTVATNTVQNLPWDGTTLFFVVVRDKAGRRTGYFTGQDSYGYNYIAANGGTGTNFALRGQVLYTNSSGTNVSSKTSETNYGVFVGTIYKDGRVSIDARYKSYSSYTINGTYNVKLYALTPYPNANPWTYSFS